MRTDTKLGTMFFTTLFAVVLLFTFQHLSDSIEYEKEVLNIEKKVGRLEILYGSIDNLVANDYKKQGYDQLQSEWKAFEALWKELKGDGFKLMVSHESITDVVALIDESMESTYNSIIRYQSAKATLINSLFYLKDLHVKTSLNETVANKEFSYKLANLLLSIIFSDVGKDEFDFNIKALKAMLSQDQAGIGGSELLELHLNNLQKQKFLLVRHIESIKGAAIDENLRVLQRELNTIVDKERALRNIVSLVIGMVALVMLVGLIVVLFNLIQDKQRILQLQKEREEQMQLLNEYRRAMDAGMIVSKTDSKGIITYSNERFCIMSGYSEQELLGKPHNIVRHPDMPKALFKELWKTIQSKHIFQGIIKNRKKDGSEYYVDATIVPILDEAGEITEYIAIRTDITELVEAKEKAQEAQKLKDSFLASISHELRTPLNAIIGFSQILMVKPDTPEHVKGYIEKIQISGQNLLELVNTILDFSKIEAGKMDFIPQQILFKNIADQIILLAEPMAEKKKIAIDLFVHDNETIYADPQLMKQTLLNLVSNAIKFSPEGTHIEVSCHNNDRVSRIIVKDYGVGIESKYLTTLFDSFTQVRTHQKEGIKGTGLGLAISKKIVQMHDGEIWIESEVGKGSSFIIELPLKDGVRS